MLRESRIKRVMGWRQCVTSGRTGSAKRSLEGEGKVQKKRVVNYYKAKPNNKPREDKNRQQEDGLLKVVE